MAADSGRKAERDEVGTLEGIGINRAREILGDLVNRAGFGGERIPILRNGKPVAALVGIRDLERLCASDPKPTSAVA